METATDWNLRHGPDLAAKWQRVVSLDVAVMHAVRKITRNRGALGMALSVGPDPTQRRFADRPPGAVTATGPERGQLQDAYKQDPNTRFHVWVQHKNGWHHYDSGTLDEVLEMKPRDLAQSCVRSARLGTRGWKKWAAVGLGVVAAAGLAAWVGFGRPSASRFNYT